MTHFDLFLKNIPLATALRTDCWYRKGRAFAKGVSREDREEAASAVLPGDEGWPLEPGAAVEWILDIS